jgi:large subunit ribosomal protein L25
MERNVSVEPAILEGKARSGTGKGPARRLRATGFVPAVIYGPGAEPVSLSVDPKVLKAVVATPHKHNTVITVKVEGQPDRLVLLKDVQQHPVTRAVEHADFQEVRLDRPLRIEVPLTLTGRAAGQADGGILTQVSRLMEILCLPGAIPVDIKVDVTPLKISQSLHEADVKLPEGIKRFGKSNHTIAVVAAPPEEVVVAAPTAAAVPGAPGAAPAAGAAPGAPGAAPAAGAPAAAGAKAGAAPAPGGKAAPAAAAAKPGGKK